jgi:putative ABC transport system permease protein
LQSGFATDTLVVSPGSGSRILSGFGGAGGSSSDFTLVVSDTQIINQIEDVVSSVAIIQKTGIIESNDQSVAAYIIGIDYSIYSEIYSSTFVAETGQILSNPENGTVVVGKRVSDPWKNGTLLCNVGDNIEIIWTNTTVRPAENVTYSVSVAAVVEEIGGLSLTGPSDYAVYVPTIEAQSFFGSDKCDRIIVKIVAEDNETIDKISGAIKEAFSNQVSVSSSIAILNTISTVFSTIELFLAGIAAISLLVAGIGIMNIMIVSLMERTREIGILKALGMKNRTVLAIFISEAAIIGILGAIFGIGLGWLLANSAARIFTGGGFNAVTEQATPRGGGFVINPVLTPEVLLGAFVFGIAISVIFAIYPAWRASKLKPVDALRYE